MGPGLIKNVGFQDLTPASDLHGSALMDLLAMALTVAGLALSGR